MILADISIKALSVEVPTCRITIDELVGERPDEADRLSALGYKSVAVEVTRSAGELARVALVGIIDQIGSEAASRADLVVHASVHDQGRGVFWNPACALQEEARALTALPISLRQGCNGLLAGLVLALRFVNDREGNAILVGSDRFDGTGFDRATADYGIMYGDGAAAISVGYGAGPYKVLGVRQVAAPDLSGFHDGAGLAFLDVRAAKKRFLARHGEERLTNATRSAMAEFAAMVERMRVEWILFPNLGRDLLEENYFPAFDAASQRSQMELGMEIGHLGTTDQLVALEDLRRSGALRPGERILLVGAGSGFSWTGLLLEVA